MYAVNTGSLLLVMVAMMIDTVAVLQVINIHMTAAEILSATAMLTPHVPMAPILSHVDACSDLALIMRVIGRAALTLDYNLLLLKDGLTRSKVWLGWLLYERHVLRLCERFCMASRKERLLCFSIFGRR